MKFTIAICTWNGSERIAKTLNSLTEMERRTEIDWELVVVDNNSTDSTKEVCLGFEDRLPIRVVTEKKQGHSYSRNCAIDHANGDYIVWTDDDVLVAPNWLSVYDSAIDRYTDVAFFGGKIIPYFEHKIPKWVDAHWEICVGVFAGRDLGDQSFEIKSLDTLPYGANFVTKREIQNRFRYDPQFGRVAKGVRGFDEIDVLSRMLNAGHNGRWVPQSSLRHLIPESRTTLKYVSDFYFGQGETWIQRGVSTLTEKAIRRKRFGLRMRYWLQRLTFSQKWLPVLTEISNLNGQLSAIQQTRSETLGS